MNKGSKFWVRVLFVVTLAFFAVQMPVIYLMKREPYPALTMPSFAGHPNESGVIERSEASVEVDFVDGRVQPVDFISLLPPTKVLTGHVLRAFDDNSFLDKPETVKWLQERVSTLFPGEHVAGLDIIWRKAYYDVNNSTESAVQYEPIHTIRVDFSGAN